MKRKIKQEVTGSRQVDGAGVRLVRVLAKETVKDFDPFLMLDAFDSENPEDYVKGFPWHPHRGIETVTYLISGKIEHMDSIGNSGTISDGCCQWMTAGSGIMHQEMPKPSDRMLGIQLWLNLPKKDKMTAPQYRDIRSEDIPEVNQDGACVRIISGEFDGVSASVKGDYVEMLFLDVTLAPDSKITIPTGEETLFVYLVSGQGYFDETAKELKKEKTALLFDEGTELFAKSDQTGLRFFLFAGKAIKEPVAWGGPIVMNTYEELATAFEELKNGSFIK